MSKPSSPKSPKSPKKDGGQAGGEKKALDLGELMQRLDEAVAKTIEDYSELFVTNVKEQRSVLEDCRDYIDKLGRENAAMAENARRRDEEAYALQEVQTEELAEQKARIEDLEAQLAQKEADIAKMNEDFRIELRQTIEHERLKRKQLQIKFGARVEELFNRRQDEVEERMAATEKETEETRAQMADLAPGFERKYIEKCLAYKEDVDKKLEEFMVKVKEEIGLRVGDRVKEVLAQNEMLLSEIYMHTSSTTGLQEESDRLKVENRKLRAEIELKAEAEELHVKRSRHQRKVIRYNDSKIQNLEKSLQQVIRQFSEERRILLEKQAYIVAELEADNKKLKSIVLQKAQELKKFRHLAEIVIRQRGEVELFLLDSIQYVKNQIVLQRKIESYQSLHLSGSNSTCMESATTQHQLGSTLPPIVKAPASWPGAAGAWPQKLQQQQAAGGGTGESLLKEMTEEQAEAQINFLDSCQDPFTVPVILPLIDISDLTKPEREKVLRLLFKKINTVRNQELQAAHAKRHSQGEHQEKEKYQGYGSTEAARAMAVLKLLGLLFEGRFRLCPG